MDLGVDGEDNVQGKQQVEDGGEQHRLQTIYELDAAPALALVQNLLETGFPSRLAHYAKYTPKYFAFRLIQINTSNILFPYTVV